MADASVTAAAAAAQAPDTRPTDANIYKGEPPEDFVASFITEAKAAGTADAAESHMHKVNPLSMLVANIAAPFYLYNELKGRADLWDKLLADVPDDLLRAPALDVATGRGMPLLKIAERKKALAGNGQVGAAYGVDAFESDNPKTTAENALALGVGEQVVVHRAKIGQPLPFQDASFGLVTSSLTLARADSDARHKAVLEMIRVCRPGGRIVIVLRKGYAGGIQDDLKAAGWSEADMSVSWAGPGVMFGMWPCDVLTAKCPAEMK